MLRPWLSKFSQQWFKAFRQPARRPDKRRPYVLRLEVLEDRFTPAVDIWTGSVDGNWNNPGNWMAGTIPVTGDELDFDTTQATVLNFATNNNLGAGFNFGPIKINDNAATAFSFAGNALNLGADLNFTSTTNTATNWSIPITLLNTLNLNNQSTSSAGAFNDTGTIALGTNTLNIIGTGNTTLTGIISSGAGGSLAMGGTGVLRLGGANTFTGGVSIANGGTVIVQTSAAALGNGGTTSIASGGTLTVGTTGLTFANPIQVAGTGVGGNGAINSTVAAATFSGAMTLTSGATITSTTAGNTITVSGGINTGSFVLTIAGAGNTVLSGIVSGPGGGSITMNGTGTLTLSGVNTFTGGVTINSGGTVNVTTSASALGTGGTTTINSGATLSVGTTGLTFANPIRAAGTGVTNNGAITTSVAATTLSGGLTLLGNTTITAPTGDTITESGAVNAANFALTAAGAGNVILSGGISGNGTTTLIKGAAAGDTGTLTVSAAGNYTGNTVVNIGTLAASANNALGTGAVTVGSPLGAATLGLSNTITLPNPITLAGGTINETANNNTLTGNIALTANSTITSTAGTLTLTGNVSLGSNTLTLNGANNIVLGNAATNGVITGAAASALTKAGAGALTLAGNSAATFSGPINDTAGSISVAATGNVSGSVFNLNGGNLLGTGTVGTLVQGAPSTINPATAGTAGTLTVLSSANSTLNGNTTYTVDLTNAPASDRIQNSGTGSITITGAHLNVNVVSLPAAGNSTYTILNSPSGVTGTFAGLANNTDLTVGAVPNQHSFRITYTGTAVTLTDLRPTSLTLSNAVPPGNARQPGNTTATSTIPGLPNGFPSVLVLDQNGTAITSLNGFPITVAIGTNPGGGTLSGTLTQNTSSGLSTFNDLSIDKVGNGYTLVFTASGGLTITSNPFNILPNAVTHFSLTVGSSVQETVPFSVLVAALDAGNNVVPGYTGTVTFTSSDGLAVLPANYTFTTGLGGDNGQHVFSGVVLNQPGVQSITATDTGNPTATGTAFINVIARPRYLVAAQDGGSSEIKVFDATTVSLRFDFFAYGPSVTGGVRVATGDVNGDNVPDIITVPGPGSASEVKVFDGATGQLLRDFFAFNGAITSGFFVAAGNLNNSPARIADIVVGGDVGASSEVKAFDGLTGAPMYDFFAYGAAPGGVRVAVGDINGDGYADIITGAGIGNFPEVKAFSGRNASALLDFFAYNSPIPGGVFVAAGDVNGDGIADIITGSGAGVSPLVNVFLGPTGSLFRTFGVFYGGFINGVHVASIRELGAVGNLSAEIAVAGGSTGSSGLIQQDPGASNNIGAVPTQVLDGLTLTMLDSFFAFPNYFGGINIAGSQ